MTADTDDHSADAATGDDHAAPSHDPIDHTVAENASVEQNGAAGTTGVLANAVAVTRNPNSLIIDNNVRETFRLEDHPELVDSIAEHGVLTPIIAYGHPDSPGAMVRDGQLRTLTAIAVGLDQVPVWLIAPDPAVDGKEAEISRVLEQITVNDRRVALTDGDRAAGIALVLDLGASVTRVGKALQSTRDDIKQAGKIGASLTARTAVDDGQLDLEQAAILAEYETIGDTDAVRQLLAAHRTHFSYEARLVANDRAERRAYFAAALPWAEAGFGVLLEYPGDHAPGPELVHVDDLADADGNALDSGNLSAEGGWLVWIERSNTLTTVDRDSGNIVDPTTVDWETEREPDREPAQGLRHARDVFQREQWQADYFLPAHLLDTQGLQLRSNLPEPQPAHIDNPDSDESSVDDVVAEQESAQRRTRAEAETTARREQERLAMRRVRELNKQGLAAMDVRRQFVTDLLARKTPPPESAKFVADALIAEPNLLGEYNAAQTAAELLAGSGSRRHDLQQLVEAAKPARCHVIVLGLVLGAIEKRTGKDCWRYSDAGVNRYLRFLRHIGHELVPVELAAIAELDYEHIDIDIDTPAREPETAAA
ncbi:ParB/RepB/Spo0J family partition protein [Nocardia sp. GTS18]|uniref:ParB/RepB/Spo0J family partition protein n=1 Tax=Nocardia sp. GTS18 TaxID=1778064 RepID=UPI0015EEE06D|nr:ParB/RepB/Spo0J family partition protein [Nocardia sp. GTS18]